MKVKLCIEGTVQATNSLTRIRQHLINPDIPYTVQVRAGCIEKPAKKPIQRYSNSTI
jgi:hypothetical protein